MIKKLKSNKIISTLLIIMCLIISINPTIYAKACLDAISLWSLKILPLLFPFFVLTKMIVNLSETKPSPLDKLFNKVFNAPAGSFNTFFLSSLAGYPTGAKLICEKFEKNQITQKQGKKMLSFCSVSGPMFMLGTVGIMMLNSYVAGLVVLISNILASLLNGLIFRGKKEKIAYEAANITQKNVNFADCVYGGLISILIVGAYVSFSFIIIEILKNIGVLKLISYSICAVFNCVKHQDIVLSVLTGTLEITTGIQTLSLTNVSLFLKTIIASGLVGFGGFSVMLQNKSFLNKLNISFKTLFLQKFTQSMLCVFFSFILLILF